MDANLPPSSTNQVPVVSQPTPMGEKKLSDLFRNKKILLIAGVVLFVIIALLSAVLLSGAKDVDTTTTNTSKSPTPTIQPIVPTMSPEEAQALKEQMAADAAYADAERATRSEFPWIDNLPLRGGKYFVYFDLQKKIFVGLLYPTGNDDVEVMKLQVLNELKQRKKVPVEKYPIEWTVTPE
jgi:hypothetical protein